MLVVVQHTLTDPPTAFVRGERLKRGEGAPSGTRVLQFLPSRDGPFVTCLWESRDVADVQSFVDDVLGDTSTNLCYAVDESASFAEVPKAVASPPTTTVP